MESVLKAPPDSTNSDLLNISQEVVDNDSGSAVQSNNSVSTSPSVTKSMTFRDPYLPEDDGSILTPEHAFVQYQTRSEDQACQICGQPAVGFHHRAYVCEACKKFFMRHTAARFRQSESSGVAHSSDTVCPMGGQCRVEGPGRGKCPHCRYRKCLDLGMTLTPPGGESGCDISQIPCRVCGGPSSGFHFGALTCEGCKGFFRRTVLSNVRLECLSNNDCPITPANRNMCKSCRFQRCLAVGMSKSGSRIGRQPNAIKYYCAREISQLSAATGDLEGTQPSSSVPLLANGRVATQNSGGRQRTTSVSSDGVKVRSPSHARTPSWSSTGPSDRTIQPAHSSTDQSSQLSSQNDGALSAKSINPNGLVRHTLDESFPSDTTRRLSLNGTQPPDSSPKSAGQKKRKFSSDRYTSFCGVGSSSVGPDPMTSRNSPITDSFASHCEPDSERLKYGSSPGLAYRESNSCMREISSTRLTRDWCVSFNQSTGEARRSYDPSVDVVSHRATPLEYSLPNPDTSTHISSTTSLLDRRSSSGSSEDMLMNTSGKLLAPLAVHLPLDESSVDEAQVQYKMMAFSGDTLHQSRREHPSSTFSHYPSPYKDPQTLLHPVQPHPPHLHHHHHQQQQQPTYRVQVVPESSPHCPGSPAPSANLLVTGSTVTITTPMTPKLHVNDPDLSPSADTAVTAASRTTRSIVDHLTSTVLQFSQQQQQQHHHQQQHRVTTSNSAAPANDSPSSVVGSSELCSAAMMIATSPSPDLSLSRMRSYVRQTSAANSVMVQSHSDSTYPSSSSTPPMRVPIHPVGHPVYPLSSPVCKPSSPDLSWYTTKQPSLGAQQRFVKSTNRSPLDETHFRSPSCKYELSPMNGNVVGVVTDPGHCSVVDVASTSSASWFAAAAAAAAVANALMAASQAAPASHSAAPLVGSPDNYPLSSKVNNNGGAMNSSRIGDMELDASQLDAFRRAHCTTTSFAKRIKICTSPLSAGGNSPTTTAMHHSGSDLDSLYGLKLLKCDPTASPTMRSFHLPASASQDLVPPPSASNLAAMRAAAAAAAAAAATAAGLVLSNSRVRGALSSAEDFTHVHRSSMAAFANYPTSPGTSSPSPPMGAFSRAIVTTAMEALYADRANQLCVDYFPGLDGTVRNSSVSLEPTPSVNLQVTSKEVSTGVTRSKNGVRATLVTLQEFSEGINAAAKYMVSERKKIRDNLPHSCPSMQSLERVEDVWDRMMQHFELHSRFIVHFVKLIPGFNQLVLDDRRQLVRGAMYPLMLLELSRDYVKNAELQFNYFDFTETERGVIFKHFPTFHTITRHLIQSGEFLDQVKLDNVELTLVCAQEVFKNYHGLIDPPATEHLYYLAGRVLVDHIVTSGQPLLERSNRLRDLSPLLEQLNLEHHQVVAQLRQDKPQLVFPELYTEMFQLTEEAEEEREQNLASGQSTGTRN
ncbi:hypothetical protein P879_02873 [Paragonimus westermani]|uniref:Uncharacterized protein n=1 Tax=Paragonimus westermani TaxID=34504 RepID=A0A8T0DJJ9_9TREM|nr:hypothetical protein P879_02873 [Paragonimus westermani]